ncbi:antibiotic biosynthesis monooxygenase family protein [Parablastomonas sp. CN1-191]|uniref:antibiotic biosynthesis monooxygenase family protein n=1 Tax=Parablastomonas sp. CN1-191 TaxID=3400908 RepID=UPI003BF8963B
MIFEIAHISIQPGCEERFERGAAAAKPLFLVAQGCLSFSLERVIERPSEYRLVVGWNSIEDHMITFRSSPAFQKWRDLVSPYFVLPPLVYHVSHVPDLN